MTSEKMRRYFRCDYSEHPSEPCWNAVCIPLTKGYHALIDAEDYGVVYSKSNWCTNIWNRRTPYASATNDKATLLHRLIANPPEGTLVDHISGNTLDNRRQNLRVCTRAQNCCNLTKRKGTSSQYKGVYYNKERQKWIAQGGAPQRRIGSFKTEEEAARAYDMKAIEHWGEFAKPNFPRESYNEHR